jgi:uncharacterized protein
MTDLTPSSLTLQILPTPLAVCRLAPTQAIPAWGLLGDFFAITRSADELSITCPEMLVPAQIQAERGWRAFKVAGPLDFALTGILAKLSGTLAKAGISLFAISTYDTDYVLVKAENLEKACEVLRKAGYRILPSFPSEQAGSML